MMTDNFKRFRNIYYAHRKCRRVDSILKCENVHVSSQDRPSGPAHVPLALFRFAHLRDVGQVQPLADLRGRPPFAPLMREAVAFAGDVTCPARRAM